MSQRYIDYFLSQQGGSIKDIGSLYKSKRILQTGFGFIPILIQKGYGIGNFLYEIYKILNPFLTSGLNAIKSEAISTGKNILDDVGKKSLKNIFTEHGTQAIQNLKQKVEKKIDTMQGKGVKKAIKKKSKRKNAHSKSKSIQAHSLKKKKRILDIFD